MNILDKIVAVKHAEVKTRKAMIPPESYSGLLKLNPGKISFREAINNTYPSVIAEFKRKSPSKGIINQDVSLYETIIGYEKAGVNAISVLTDSRFFGGSLCDLQDSSIITKLPVLRKDFVIDEYQLIEARAFGASAVLLIASILSKVEVKKLSARAIELGMDVLFEIHEEKELEKWCPEIKIVGINSRNLATFDVNIENSIKLLDKIPDECIKVAESGISGSEVAGRLFVAGFNAFLIGETFMKTEKPWVAAREFVNSVGANGFS